VWHGIKQRCHQPNDPQYSYYGARGIRVCDEWINDFVAFRDWAMANGFREEPDENGRNRCTLDRIDNNGNYQVNNCRWVSPAVQNNNRRGCATGKMDSMITILLDIAEARQIGVDEIISKIMQAHESRTQNKA